VSSEERTGRRDLTYSGWHREDVIRSYGLTRYQAWLLGLIDIDGCEYCRHCREPLVLIETQVSARAPKPAPVTAVLAKRAGIPAYSVSIELVGGEPVMFRFRRLEPPLDTIKEMEPREFAWWLLSLRTEHECTPC
jgi:hypothetical protein